MKCFANLPKLPLSVPDFSFVLSECMHLGRSENPRGRGRKFCQHLGGLPPLTFPTALSLLFNVAICSVCGFLVFLKTLSTQFKQVFFRSRQVNENSSASVGPKCRFLIRFAYVFFVISRDLPSA